MSKEFVKKNFKTYYAACKSIHDRLEKRWGYVGWNSLGETFQHALIAEQVLHVFAGRDEESKISPMDICKYIEAVRRYCNLLPDDE